MKRDKPLLKRKIRGAISEPYGVIVVFLSLIIFIVLAVGIVYRSNAEADAKSAAAFIADSVSVLCHQVDFSDDGEPNRDERDAVFGYSAGVLGEEVVIEGECPLYGKETRRDESSPDAFEEVIYVSKGCSSPKPPPHRINTKISVFRCVWSSPRIDNTSEIFGESIVNPNNEANSQYILNLLVQFSPSIVVSYVEVIIDRERDTVRVFINSCQSKNGVGFLFSPIAWCGTKSATAYLPETITL